MRTAHSRSPYVWGGGAGGPNFLYQMGLQVVLGVSYHILKFQVDWINTFGDMAIQNLDPHLVKGSSTQNFLMHFWTFHMILRKKKTPC